MHPLVWQLALLVAACALVQALLGGIHMWENQRFAAGRIRAKRRTLVRVPRVRVCVPCKGIDVGLEANLRPLFAQHYSNYELVFIVESADDPAAGLIRRLLSEHPAASAELIIAGRATDCGQKVHNLRAATANLPPQVEMLAFMDSDARPHADWLLCMVERLLKVDCGAATGYRWFVPERASLANWLLYGINAQVAVMLGPGGHHVVWGGSWAIRRTTFTALGMHEAWAGAVSDDLVATRLLQQSGMRTEFVPNCLVGSPLDVTPGQGLEFLRRQYVMVRFHLPRVFWYAATILSLSVAGFWGTLAVGAAGWMAGAAWWPWVLGMCGAHYFLAVARGVVRQRYLRTCLPGGLQRVGGAWLFDCLSGPLTTLVHWLGVLSALAGNEVVWRSIRYRLSPGGRVEVVGARPTDAGAQARPPVAVPKPHRRGAERPALQTADCSPPRA